MRRPTEIRRAGSEPPRRNSIPRDRKRENLCVGNGRRRRCALTSALSLNAPILLHEIQCLDTLALTQQQIDVDFGQTLQLGVPLLRWLRLGCFCRSQPSENLLRALLGLDQLTAPDCQLCLNALVGNPKDRVVYLFELGAISAQARIV